MESVVARTKEPLRQEIPAATQPNRQLQNRVTEEIQNSSSALEAVDRVAHTYEGYKAKATHE